MAVPELGAQVRAPERGVTGYTVVLPPGWCRIPVRYGSAKAIRGVIGQALKSVPGGVPAERVAEFRAELQARLKDMVTQARRQGGLDLYLPAAPMHGMPVAASFIVSEGTFGEAAPGVSPAEMVALLAAESGGSGSVLLDGSPALRREHAAPPVREAEELASRRVDYVVPVPGEDGRWLIAAFATPGAGDPADELSGILVQLFDAIMSTFRWSRPDAGIKR